MSKIIEKILTDAQARSSQAVEKTALNEAAMEPWLTEAK
jgi:hypothetical protein